jgi:succinate dehydrogenase / fumarate reductase, membrane anchor subunit
MAIGAKRLVVGAHYGLRDWLAQRLTALILAAYTLFFALYLVVVVRGAGVLGYDQWAGMFAPVWMKVLTLIALLALMYHAWIGMRDVWMDYVRPTGIRLGLLLLTILWLVFCAIWSAQILWSV